MLNYLRTLRTYFFCILLFGFSLQEYYRELQHREER